MMLWQTFLKIHRSYFVICRFVSSSATAPREKYFFLTNAIIIIDSRAAATVILKAAFKCFMSHEQKHNVELIKYTVYDIRVDFSDFAPTFYPDTQQEFDQR